MRKRKIRIGSFVDRANAEEGIKRGDAIVIVSRKGEDTETTMGVNLNGGPSRIIEVV